MNRKLAAMGIEKIGKRTVAAGNEVSPIPNCSSIPPGWKGEWQQISGSSSGPGYSIYASVPPGTWVLVICAADKPGYTGSANTGSTSSGNRGAG